MVLNIVYLDILYGREGVTDLGRVGEFGADGPSLRFSQPLLNPKPGQHEYNANGADLQSAFWSRDSRFFVVTSHADSPVLGGLRDAWVWDSQERQATILPNLSKIAPLPDGRLQVSLPGQEPLAVGSQELPELAASSELKSRPQISVEGKQLVLRRFRGEQQVLVENRDDYSTLLPSTDCQDLIGIKKGSPDILGNPTGAQQVVVWNLASGARLDLLQDNGLLPGNPPTSVDASPRAWPSADWPCPACEKSPPTASSL